MNLRNQGFSFTLIFSLIVIVILVFFFWPLPDSVTNEEANLQTAAVEAKQDATTTQANTSDNTTDTNIPTNASTSGSASYLTALDGVNGLRDKAIAYYNRTGVMPGTADLLNAPLDNQTTTSLKDSSFLHDHKLGTIGLFPGAAGSLCQNAIKIEGTYYENSLSVTFDLSTVSLNGGWKTICMYGVEGADPASIKIDGCFNRVTEESELQKELSALQNACGG